MSWRFLTGLTSGALASLLVWGSPALPARGHELEPLRSSVPMMLVQESIDRVIGAAAIELRRGLRQFSRTTVVSIKRAFKAWGRYARRGVKFALLALLIGLADGNLLAAWRASGIRVLISYVPLMTYVYTRLLFDRRVYATGKLLLFAALAYGVLRRDLIPDRTLFPGLVDDVVLLTVAVRLFVNWCSDETVYAHASEAIERFGRVAAWQRARQGWR
jgi:uncharacterized membrane protein YkvA (DUF1232 family)